MTAMASDILSSLTESLSIPMAMQYDRGKIHQRQKPGLKEEYVIELQGHLF